MDIRDFVTPKTVVVVLGAGLLPTIVSIVLAPETYGSPAWSRYMDLVTIAGLLVTLTILSDLDELQDRYLLRATIGDLQKSLKQRAENLGQILRSGFEDSKREIARELSKEDGILKQIADRTETVDPDVYEEATTLRQEIKAYTGRGERTRDKVYDIWQDTHTLNELVKGLIEESKWKR